jgi:hypothetical protein
MAVHRQIPQLIDDPCLVEDSMADGSFEGRLMDESAQVVLVGKLEGTIPLVDPGYRDFERAACVEAGGAGVGMDRVGDFDGGVVDSGLEMNMLSIFS